MSWSRHPPFKAGFFWYRETSGEQAVSLEVFYKGGQLYCTPPSHALPAPLSEIKGEWTEDGLVAPTSKSDIHQPGRFIRAYPLNDTLTLIFTDAARMFVRYRGEGPGGAMEIADYDPPEFDELEVAGQSVADLVAGKLSELLPPGAADEFSIAR